MFLIRGHIKLQYFQSPCNEIICLYVVCKLGIHFLAFSDDCKIQQAVFSWAEDVVLKVKV